MTRLETGFPCAAGICKLNLDTFHIERNRGTARKNEFDGSIRPIALLLELDGQQRQHFFVVLAVKADGTDGVDALEGEQAAAALERFAAAFGRCRM